MHKPIIRTADIILEDHHSQNKFANYFLKLQDFFDNGIYNHLLVSYDGELCIEAGFQGVRFRKIDLLNQRYTVFRYNGKIYRDAFKKSMDKYLEEHKKYSYLGLASAALSTIYWRLTSQKKQFFPDEHKPYCAELGAELYKLNGLELDINDNIITPNDFARSDKFQIVRR